VASVWRARVLFWLQKSARGVGLREATLVAARVGDGGLARKRETAQCEGTPRGTPPGNGWYVEGPVEGHLLVEGAPDRGSPRPSRVGGEIGLGPSDRSALAVGPRWATGALELRRSRVGSSEQLLRVREAVGRSGSRGVKLLGPPLLQSCGSHAKLGFSSLKCGLQMSARRISDGCAPEPSGF
jgi:hypothetical protein